MKASSEYTVMGEDGQEYGPVTAAQIRQWIAEQRLERKTPVKTVHAHDWTFLGDVPEFRKLFLAPPIRPPQAPPRRQLVVTALLVALGAGIYFFFKHLNPH
jgi:hypothetical protein